MLKRQDAFTLVELLAVIIILGIILLLAVPRISDMIDKYRNKAYERQLDLILRAAEVYSILYEYEIEWEGDQAFIYLEDLQEKDLIASSLKNPKGGDLEGDKVKITLTKSANGAIDYEIEVEKAFVCGDEYFDNKTQATHGTMVGVSGRCWLDNDLGGYFQWGRGADGHQVYNSPTTSTLSTSDNPGHSNFIITSQSPYDWRNPSNDNLWQGGENDNNPCPTGFHVPTSIEWEDELEAAGPTADDRYNGVVDYLGLYSLNFRGIDGKLTPGAMDSGYFYWSSTIVGEYPCILEVDGETYGVWVTCGYYRRGDGMAVRCIKDQ